MLQSIEVKTIGNPTHQEFEKNCSNIMGLICVLKEKNDKLNALKKQYLNQYFG